MAIVFGALLYTWAPEIPGLLPAALQPGRTATAALRDYVTREARKNLFHVYLKLDAVWDAAAQARQGERSMFERLPAQATRNSLEISFCRVLESQVPVLEPDFVLTAQAYCNQVTDFAASEKQWWEVWSRGTEPLLRDWGAPEARAVLVCGLKEIERLYLLRFALIERTAKAMGITEAALLDLPPEARPAARAMGIPDLRQVGPRIMTLLRAQFGDWVAERCK